MLTCICMQNVIKVWVKNYEHFHKLLTDGHIDIDIIVRTQGLYNYLLFEARHEDVGYPTDTI